MSLSSRSSSSGHSSSSKGDRGQQPPSTGYFAYRHPFDGLDGGLEQVEVGQPALSESRRYNSKKVVDYRGKGTPITLSNSNGALNFHIPCAFSYPFDVPVPPQSKEVQKLASKTSTGSFRPNSKAKKQTEAPERVHSKQSIVSGANSKQIIATGRDSKQSILGVSHRPAMPTTNSRANIQASMPATRPFVTTVKTGQLFKAKNVLPRDASRTLAKTSVVWDFHAGSKVPFQVVDYGQELYEQAAKNLAQQLEQQHIQQSGRSNESDVEDNCFDFSKPGINSSKNTSRALEKAIEDLKHLPEEVEQLLRKDKRFEPIITTMATRALNTSRSSKIYKDLIPVDPNPDVRTEAEKLIQAEIRRSMEAVRHPGKVKDPEPNLEDFQTNSYTRIRPAVVPAPPKPTAGISTDANHDFDTIEEENVMEAESNLIE